MVVAIPIDVKLDLMLEVLVCAYFPYLRNPQIPTMVKFTIVGISQVPTFTNNIPIKPTPPNFHIFSMFRLFVLSKTCCTIT